MSEFYTIVTEKGITELQNCLDTNQAFNAVSIAIGDANGSYYEPEGTQTSLRNEVYRGRIYAKGKRDNYIYFDLQLPPSEGDYVIREAGLFDSENNLLAVSKYPETLKTKATGDNVTILNIEIQIELSTNAINTIVIEETGNLVTQENLKEFANTIQIANRVKAGLVKIGENVNVEPDGTISVKQTSGYQLFDLVQKDHILTYEESEGLTLQGEWAYCDAVTGEHFGYPDFYNQCLKEKSEAVETRTVLGVDSIVTYNHANGHIYYDIADKNIVDTYFNNNGVAWFYGIDETNKRILMPRNKYFFRNSSENVGSLNLPGAPSISHSHSYSDTDTTYTTKREKAAPPQQANSWNWFVNTLTASTASSSKNTGGVSSLNAVYGRETSQIMVTSTNVALYIVTGTIQRDYANIISGELEKALDDIETEKQTCIDALNLVGGALTKEIEDTFNNALEVIQTEGEVQTENARLQAENAQEQAEIARRYANMAVAGQIQADFEQTNPDAVDYIRNKPDFITREEAQNLAINNLNIPSYYEFNEFDWVENAGIYRYIKDGVYGVFGIYKNIEGMKYLIHNVDIIVQESGVIIESLEPFDGYIFGIKTVNTGEIIEEDEDDNEFTEEELEELIIKDFDEI